MNRGATKYYCEEFIGLKLKIDKWKCFDHSIWRVKCFEYLQVDFYEGDDGKPPFLRQCPYPLCIRFYCFTCLLPERKACNLHVCDTYDEPEGTINEMVHCFRCPRAWHHDCMRKEQILGKYYPDREIYEHTWEYETWFMFHYDLHIIDLNLGMPIMNHFTHDFQLM